MSDSSNKSVLVLGGSRGIGAAIVRRFASDGARVTFTYASSGASAKALATATASNAVHLDSADRGALDTEIANLGPLDILVVNAGVFIAGDPLELDADAIDLLFRINIHAPYHAAIAAARQMPEGGRIIFIGSTNAERTPMPGMAAYGASKAALTGMVKGLARDFGPRGITVNVVQPGPTDTDMNPADGPLNELMHSFMAIQRHARSDEIAGLVAWLAGAEAGLVTGAALTIDGGFAA
ncbi:SDR family oxidoreductase [Phytopseudomonas dryadis]|uniref:Oxidoreductase n=1 Tax=Phytopseudomonas dryadis TaxID=2487520 RepID=A0A4V2KC11_9GAMM|nr:MULTISPECIES: SDR family oxidoreductase [Pseudomonas]TBU90579.1 oxidoreductase [Pseudomonas dryadis]TBV03754.1 oxidoreductase [Pseudomonas dryadis]TBV15971.1 oxidoreductase [Pseudomonas sp. FRB 230]